MLGLMPAPTSSHPVQQAKNLALLNDKQGVAQTARCQKQLDGQGGMAHPIGFGGQHLYEQAPANASSILQESGHLSGSPAAVSRAQFLRKVHSLQQLSMRCLNVGATATLQQLSGAGAAEAGKGATNGQIGYEQLL